MKHIVICCDGTWNNRDRTDHPTSVARIAAALEDQVKAGRNDLRIRYIEGVGATNGLKGFRRAVDKLRGGALGRGLSRNIMRGYAHIVRHYEPGDRIHIFGFSRGAYTARSLAGLVRASGVTKDFRNLARAMRRYRDDAAETAPKTDESMRFRAEISPRFFTNDKEREWREREGITPGDPINLAYVGVFDTVGTNGVPGVLAQLGFVAGGHGFHDHELSSMVQSGRHAMGLDERRVLYGPTEWSNLPILNDEAGPDAEGGARYRQLWFPGEHGKIGGSGAERRISNSILDWILEGATTAGLDVKLSDDLRADDANDFLGTLDNGQGGFDPTAIIKAPRRGPDLSRIEDLHPLSLLRLQWREDYRPKSLRRLLRSDGWLARVTALLGDNTRYAGIRPGTRQV